MGCSQTCARMGDADEIVTMPLVSSWSVIICFQSSERTKRKTQGEFGLSREDSSPPCTASVSSVGTLSSADGG